MTQFFRWKDAVPGAAVRFLPDYQPAWIVHCQTDGWQLETDRRTHTARLVDTVSGRTLIQEEEDLLSTLCSFLNGQNTKPEIRRKTGLVLAGGGARGAYEIGVWKALIDMGIDRAVTGISGSSIGAVNSLLFAGGDWEAARDIWHELSRKNCFIKQAELKEQLSRIIRQVPGEKREKFSIFSTITPFEERMEFYPFALDLSNRPRTSPERTDSYYIPWRGLSESDIVQLILASAAHPVPYEKVNFFGRPYVDGGVFDNVPMWPLYREGYRQFIVVLLSRGNFVPFLPEPCEACQIYTVQPDGAFRDDIYSTTDLSLENTKELIDWGYADAMCSLSPYLQSLTE